MRVDCGPDRDIRQPERAREIDDLGHQGAGRIPARRRGLLRGAPPGIAQEIGKPPDTPAAPGGADIRSDRDLEFSGVDLARPGAQKRADVEGGREDATLARLDLQSAQDRFVQFDREGPAAQSPAGEIEKRGVVLGGVGGGGGVARVEVGRPKAPHGIEELEQRDLAVFAVARRERALIAAQVRRALGKRADPQHQRSRARDLVADLARQAVARERKGRIHLRRRLASLRPQIHRGRREIAIRLRPVRGRTVVPGAREPEELLQTGMNLLSLRNGREASNDVLRRRRAGQRRTQIRDQQTLLDQLGNEPFDSLRVDRRGLGG